MESRLKTPIVRDKDHLARVRAMRCLLCGATPCDPAHVRDGLGGGMGMKPSDDLVVPLCHPHHAEQHRVGEVPFWLRAVQVQPLLLMKFIKHYAKGLHGE